MKSIDFSIIIPVYNASRFLEECLESVLDQTHKNIEVICIDDASADGSLEISRQYAKQDQRIRIIAESINVGTSKARKDGVLCSRGKYILFVDADDKLMNNACERLLEIEAEEPADIVQFDAYVNECNGISKEQAEEVARYLKPCCEKIGIEEMRRRCFGIGSLSHSLWGKIFSGDVCRKAFAYISDDKMIMAEDMYAYFAISVFAETYRGIPDKLYQYNYGAGITRAKKEFLDSFEDNCQQLLVPSKCMEFIQDIGMEKKYAALVEETRKYLIDVFLCFWINYNNNINGDNIASIQKILLKYCTKEDLGYVCVRLSMYFQNREAMMANHGWTFPYHCIPRDSRIIIYGAGNVGKDYYDQIIKTGYCEIVAWVDQAYEQIEKTKNIILSPEIIKNVDYDYIVIAIRNIEIKNEVKKYLISMGVQKADIVQE